MPEEFLVSNVSECPHKYNLCYCINTDDYIMTLMLAEILYVDIFLYNQSRYPLHLLQNKETGFKNIEFGPLLKNKVDIISEFWGIFHKWGMYPHSHTNIQDSGNSKKGQSKKESPLQKDSSTATHNPCQN